MEAPKAVLEAGETWEALNKLDDARHCYRYLAEAYAGQPVARKAGGAYRGWGWAANP